MKRLLRISNSTTLVLGSVSIAGLVFTNTFFALLWYKIISLSDVEKFLDSFSVPVALVYIFFGIFHLWAVLTLVLQLYFFKRDNFLRAFLFFTGITSLLMLLGDFALANDIAKEYTFGFPSEFYILFFSQAIHFIFFILMIILLVMTGKEVRERDEEIVLKDDSIFINAQYIGILSGISGLVLTGVFSAYYFSVTCYFSGSPLPPWALKAGVTATSLIAVVPYLLIIVYWLILKLRERIGEWYDEKQYQDLARSSLVSLITSIVLLLIIFIIQYIFEDIKILGYIWFPLYFFFTLLLFSSTTLFFNKRG